MIRRENRAGAGRSLRGCHAVWMVVLLSWGMHSSAPGAQSRIVVSSDTALAFIQLPHHNIYKGSLQVSQGGEAAALSELKRVDWQQGILFLEPPLQLRAPLEISYRYLDYALPEYYFRRKLEQPEMRTPASPALQPPHAREPSGGGGPQFIFSGSKAIVVSAGNVQSTQLDQTLNLRISGQPLPGVEVTGALTDRATPQLGGLTSTLEDIDAVSLKIAGAHFSSELGDIVYRSQWGGLADLSKKMKGVDLSVNVPSFSSRATVAGLKGQYRSLNLQGRDGVAGPYRLTNGTGGRAAILGGTVRVYLDGRLLNEGAGEDYVLDYGLGELTFNPRILITSRSRITIDYEYLEDAYRRNLYASEFELGAAAEWLSISGGYLELADSRSSPVGLSLTSDDESVMAIAGDDQSRAVRSGAVQVGAGKGAYVLDSAGGLYRYVGANLGDYAVSFTRVTDGAGDYAYVGGGAYVFRGKGQGNYLPFQYLRLPERARAAYLSGSLTMGRAAKLDLKAAGSDHDRNLFSEQGDRDNQGILGSARLVVQPLDSSRNAGWLRFSRTVAAVQRQDHRFYVPGRIESVERARRWGLRADSIANRADEWELSQSLYLRGRVSLQGELGRLRDRGIVGADRNLLRIGFEPMAGLSLAAERQDRVADYKNGRTGERLYQDRISGAYAARRWKVSGGWEDELDGTGFLADSGVVQFDRYFSRVSYGGIFAELARKHQVQSAAGATGNQREWVASGGVRQGLLDGRLAVEADLSRRRVESGAKGQPSESETRTSSRAIFKTPGNWLAVELGYRLNQQLLSSRVRNFIFVGEGQGQFRKEDSVYVPDPLGSFIAVDEVLEGSESGLSSERTLTLRTEPTHLWPRSPGKVQVSTETNYSLAEDGDRSYRLNLLYLVPNWKLYPQGSPRRESNLRQVVNLAFPRGDLLTLGLEEQIQSERSASLSSSQYRKLLYERLLLVPDRALNLALEHRFKSEREQSPYYGAADFQEQDFTAELRWLKGKNAEFDLAPRYLIDLSGADDLRVDLWGARAVQRIGLPSRGRLNGEFSFYHVRAEAGRFVPYQFAAGNRPGDNLRWSLSLDLRYSQNISVQVKYAGDKLPQLSARHQARVSMKASF